MNQFPSYFTNPTAEELTGFNRLLDYFILLNRIVVNTQVADYSAQHIFEAVLRMHAANKC